MRILEIPQKFKTGLLYWCKIEKIDTDNNKIITTVPLSLKEIIIWGENLNKKDLPDWWNTFANKYTDKIK